MSKEDGMKKLIMLIDIYEEEVVGVHSVGEKITDKEEARIISKKFGFIEWLVESEKIDLYKLPIRLEEYYQNTEAVGYITDDENILLMELAIQDEPIKFLCEILKDEATEKIDKLLNGVKKTCENIGI